MNRAEVLREKHIDRLLRDAPLWQSADGTLSSFRQIDEHNDRRWKELMHTLVRRLLEYNPDVSTRRAYSLSSRYVGARARKQSHRAEKLLEAMRRKE